MTGGLVTLTVALFAAGCATATIEDAVPQGAFDQTASSETIGDGEAAISSGTAQNTGEYPDLNQEQRGELAQMTPQEKNEHLARLAAARADQSTAGAGAGRTQSEAEIRKLARSHDDEVLKEIEGEKTEEEDAE